MTEADFDHIPPDRAAMLVEEVQFLLADDLNAECEAHLLRVTQWLDDDPRKTRSKLLKAALKLRQPKCKQKCSKCGWPACWCVGKVQPPHEPLCEQCCVLAARKHRAVT